MSFDRTTWAEVFTKNNLPKWKCDTCDGSALIPDMKMFHVVDTAETRKDRDAPYFNAEFDKQRFISIFECSDPACKESYIVSGMVRVDEIYPEDHLNEPREFVTEFLPKYVSPSPKIISIPRNCPTSVRNYINGAGTLFLGEPSSAGNKLRSAVEETLNDIEAEKSLKTAHRKIESIRDKFENDDVYTQLMALKWIGNSGSHSNNLTTKSVLDGFQILEQVLQELYPDDKKSQSISISRKINDDRGPSSKK